MPRKSTVLVIATGSLAALMLLWTWAISAFVFAAGIFTGIAMILSWQGGRASGRKSWQASFENAVRAARLRAGREARGRARHRFWRREK